MIELKNICKEFIHQGKTFRVLENVSFDIRAKEVLGIQGPTGCGKSTLLKIIGQVEPASGGEIVCDKKKYRAPIVWQDHRLFPWLTVKQNISIALANAKIEKVAAEVKAENLLQLIGLALFADYYPWQLSGGMCQRVAIARALAYDPDVLLLDEAFNSLDFVTKDKLFREIIALCKDKGVPIVYVTHDPRDVELYCDHALTLSNRPATVVSG